MRTAGKIWIIAAPVLGFALSSCVSQRVLLRPRGDTVAVAMRDSSGLLAELWAVTDSTIALNLADVQAYFPQGAREEIRTVRLNDVHSITVQGYANRNWVAPLLLFEAIPVVLMGIAASRVEGTDVGGIMLITAAPLLLNYAILEASTPRAPRFQQPFTPDRLALLKKHARFPQEWPLRAASEQQETTQ